MTIPWIRQAALESRVLAGTFLGLGSSAVAEISSQAGFDWLLFDLEHGLGGRQQLVQQLQAVQASNASPIVRVPECSAATFKRILDLGPAGLMVPFVSTAGEAEKVVTTALYPPNGQRGVARFTRASTFGSDFDNYFTTVNDNLLLVAQIETVDGVENAEEIAAVERIDCLFVGPLDLSVALGQRSNFDHPDFRAATRRVVAACGATGKAAGILVAQPADIGRYIDEGFTFIACGSDGGLLANGMRETAGAFDRWRRAGT